MEAEIEMALSAIKATEGAPEVLDESADGQGDGKAARNFSQAQGFRGSWQEWEAF